MRIRQVASAPFGGTVELTNEDVADILALLDSLPYDEFDLRTPRFRLTLRRAPGDGWTEESQVLADPVALPPATDGAKGEAAERGGAGGVIEPGEVADTGAAARGRDGLAAVAAPLPGTFYRAPRPGAAPFVEVGDEVGEDTVVAIVETMKLMNSVHAGVRGRVAEICLDNAAPAAQGATLMLIEPRA
ncbi:MAG TPA: biotin/lipoyl-containing protein [Trebonia sp.]|nr:biotin/lipoyl-containing protein [Trebonia sp.]